MMKWSVLEWDGYLCTCSGHTGRKGLRAGEPAYAGSGEVWCGPCAVGSGVELPPAVPPLPALRPSSRPPHRYGLVDDDDEDEDQMDRDEELAAAMGDEAVVDEDRLEKRERVDAFVLQMIRAGYGLGPGSMGVQEMVDCAFRVAKLIDEGL